MSDNDKDFNRLRARFSRLANAPGIPALASKLCWWIAFGRMDIKRRSTFVTQITLANDLGGVSVRSVQRMIDVLKPLGLKVAPGHGPEKASTYWIGEANTTSMSPIEADNTTSMSPIQQGQGDTGVGPRRHFKRRKATLVSRRIKNSKKISKKVSNKSAPARSSADDDRYSTSVDAAENPAFDTSDDAASPAPSIPVQRAPDGSLKPRQPPPCRASEMGTVPASDGDAARQHRMLFDIIRINFPHPVGDEAEALRLLAVALSLRGNRYVIEKTQPMADDPAAPTLCEVLRAIIEQSLPITSQQ